MKSCFFLFLPIKETHYKHIPFLLSKPTPFFLTKFRILISLITKKISSIYPPTYLNPHHCLFSLIQLRRYSKAIHISIQVERKKDGRWLGTSCCLSRFVHPLVTRATVPVPVKDKSSRIWKHADKWDCHSGPCCNIFLHNHHLGCCYWYSHTC